MTAFGSIPDEAGCFFVCAGVQLSYEDQQSMARKAPHVEKCHANPAHQLAYRTRQALWLQTNAGVDSFGT
jgi:hypothetical protein